MVEKINEDDMFLKYNVLNFNKKKGI